MCMSTINKIYIYIFTLHFAFFLHYNNNYYNHLHSLHFTFFFASEPFLFHFPAFPLLPPPFILLLPTPYSPTPLSPPTIVAISRSVFNCNKNIKQDMQIKQKWNLCIYMYEKFTKHLQC